MLEAVNIRRILVILEISCVHGGVFCATRKTLRPTNNNAQSVLAKRKVLIIFSADTNSSHSDFL